MPASPPPRRPTGVRAAPTITASRMVTPRVRPSRCRPPRLYPPVAATVPPMLPMARVGGPASHSAPVTHAVDSVEPVARQQNAGASAPRLCDRHNPTGDNAIRPGDSVAIRPSVPSNGPDPNDDRNRAENRANDDRANQGGADQDGADQDAVDQAGVNSDRANNESADRSEPWSRDWDAEIEPPRTPATDVRFRCDQRFMWVKFIGAVVFIGTPIVASASWTGLIV